MKSRSLLSGAVALLVAASVQARPTDGKNESELLAALASGTAGEASGGVTTTTGLGVFEAVGLGSNGDAELTRALSELDVLTATIADLQNDDATLLASLPAGADATAFQAALVSMSASQTAILSCAAAVEALATAPGSEATDSGLLAFAGEISGLSPGNGTDCDSVPDDFAAIDAAVVGDSAGQVEGAYMPLARAMKSSFTFERLASHFIQYALTQRVALGLLRSAYSVLGSPDALHTALTSAPHDFLDALHAEEIAFLRATDTFVVTGQPSSYSVLPGAFADAIVQRLEGVRTQVSSYSLSVVDAPPFTPAVHDASNAAVSPTDHLDGSASTYYDAPDVQLHAGIADCANPQASDGYSYVRPYAGTGAGFKVGSTCTVHVARHLERDVSADPTQPWSVRGRYATADQTLAFMPRNAATLADESAADALSLAGNAAGSGASAFTVLPDASDPSVISLAIDLPNQPNTPVRVSDTHPFAAAGTGDVARFTLVPFGPDAPDRYALAVDGSYLAVAASGFAELAASPAWFDFRPTADGHTELAADGGVLFVDLQSLQGFFGEAPDTSLVNAANIATGIAFAGWTVPSDLPRPAPSGQLSLFPNCLQPSGTTAPATPVAPFNAGSTECSDFDLAYQEYVAVFKNEDTLPRSFQFTLGATVTWVPAASVSVESGGLHCFSPYIGSPDDHFDNGDLSVTAAAPTVTLTPFTFTPAGWYLSIPALGTFELDCQVLDWGGNPSGLVLDNFTVQPCRRSGSGACPVYQ